MDFSVDVTGTYNGSPISISSGSRTFTLAPPAGGNEGFTAKFNENLSLDWAVNTSDPSGSTLDGSTNFGISLNFQQDIDYVVGVDNNNNTAFVEVLNDGDGSWIATNEMTISTGGNAEANAVVTDAAGNAYVVGDFSGSLTPTTTSAHPGEQWGAGTPSWSRSTAA